MAGKGSKPRPIEVDRKTFESNWDRIFNKENKDLAYESDNPLERPYDLKLKAMTELNADGNDTRGRYGEDLENLD